MKTQIIAGFPGIGKTYLKENDSSVLDLESSNYHWIYDASVIDQNKEERKGCSNKKLNPQWPWNYIRDILAYYETGEYSYILVAAQLSIMELLSTAQVPFIVVVPNKDCKEEYRRRYQERHNPSPFISKVFSSWDYYMEEIKKYSDVFYLQAGQYLSDVIFQFSKDERRSKIQCKKKS